MRKIEYQGIYLKSQTVQGYGRRRVYDWCQIMKRVWDKSLTLNIKSEQNEFI